MVFLKRVMTEVWMENWTQTRHYSTTMGICKSELNGNWRKGRPRLTQTGKKSPAKKARKSIIKHNTAIDMKKKGKPKCPRVV